MDYKYPITAINRDRTTLVLYSIDDVRAFVKKYGWWGKEWQKSWFWYDYGYRNAHPSIPWNWSRRNEPVLYEWIMRDDWGRKVDPLHFDFSDNSWRTKRLKKIRHAEENGLPIPGTGTSKAGWKINHTAKKNSGAGHRNRNRAKAIYEAEEYGVKNDVGTRVIPWENF